MVFMQHTGNYNEFFQKHTYTHKTKIFHYVVNQELHTVPAGTKQYQLVPDLCLSATEQR